MNIILKILLVYYSIVNFMLFFMMGIDKQRAKRNNWRIPESNLFITALFGGGLGGFFGMHFFHHKNRKASFYIIFLLSIVFHILFLYCFFSLF